MASAAVSLLAPAAAGGRARESTIVFLSPPSSDAVVERGFTVPPGTVEVDIDVAGPDVDVGYPRDFGVRGPAGIRGWTIARHGRVHIDAASASYGYLPGPIEPGEWRMMFGPGADALRVTVRLSDRLEGPRPLVREREGWFAGDLHTHSGHSDGYTITREGGATPLSVAQLSAAAVSRGLDFLAVTDHNTISHWVDVDRTQAASPGVLLLHGREITGPRGHLNAIGERRFSDFRVGPLRPMSQLLADLGRDDVFRSINHPWIGDDVWCAGCGWRDRDPQTIASVDGVEVLNGASTNVGAHGDLPGWMLWAEWSNRGHRLTLVGGSDVHSLERGGASVGTPSTVVWAAALSEDAIVRGLRSGRAFVRAVADPRLFVELTAEGAGVATPMGGSIAPGLVTLRARVRGAVGARCEWFRRGVRVRSSQISKDDGLSTLTIQAAPGDWFSVVVRRGMSPVLMSNAVYVAAR